MCCLGRDQTLLSGCIGVYLLLHRQGGALVALYVLEGI